MQEKEKNRTVLSIEEYLEMRRERNKILKNSCQNDMIVKDIEFQITKEIHI